MLRESATKGEREDKTGKEESREYEEMIKGGTIRKR